jgi:phospholipase C
LAVIPGADGLYAGPAGPYTHDQVPGFTQLIVNTDGTVGTITPFKIPATVTDAAGKTVPIYPADIASVNHSHTALARKIALDANGVAQNSEYALTEEGVTLKDGKPSKAPTLERKQFGELVMATWIATRRRFSGATRTASRSSTTSWTRSSGHRRPMRLP